MTLDVSMLAEGDELPPLELQPDLGQVIRYCALIWAFPPFFFDAEAARARACPARLCPARSRSG